MDTQTLELHQAADGVDAYAIRLPNDAPDHWRAERGFGSDYHEVWTLELHSSEHPELAVVDWDTVLERALEAYQLSDPVITNFEWPQPVGS